MTLATAWAICKQTVNSWVDDYAPSMGAAIAYYTIFSIAPLLLIVITVAGYFFGDEAARNALLAQLGTLLGSQSTEAVATLLANVNQPARTVTATLFSIAVLLIGATTVFAELQSALDRIWRAPAGSTGSGLWYLIRSRLLSLGMILGLAFLLMVSLVLSAALAAAAKWWAPYFGSWLTVLQVINSVTNFALVTVMFALINKVMPRVHVNWRDVWIGAAATALLFEIGKILIGLYIGETNVASGFGAAASLVVLLIWVYYSAQIFLLGAEFIKAYSDAMRGRPVNGKGGES